MYHIRQRHLDGEVLRYTSARYVTIELGVCISVDDNMTINERSLRQVPDARVQLTSRVRACKDSPDYGLFEPSSPLII